MPFISSHRGQIVTEKYLIMKENRLLHFSSLFLHLPNNSTAIFDLYFHVKSKAVLPLSSLAFSFAVLSRIAWNSGTGMFGHAAAQWRAESSLFFLTLTSTHSSVPSTRFRLYLSSSSVATLFLLIQATIMRAVLPIWSCLLRSVDFSKIMLNTSDEISDRQQT